MCEVQICHNSLLVARKGLPGHLIYGRVRNATELLEQLDLALDEWTHRLNTDLCRGLMRCASGRGAGAWQAQMWWLRPFTFTVPELLAVGFVGAWPSGRAA